MDVLFAQRSQKGNGGARRRSTRRHFDRGVCLAALRGITGARLFIEGGAPTVKAAAAATASCPQYVAAAITLLQGDNVILTNEVLTGRVGLLEAARRANGYGNGHGKPRNGETLAEHIARSSSAERVEAARTVGIDALWDSMILPVIAAKQASAE